MAKLVDASTQQQLIDPDTVFAPLTREEKFDRERRRQFRKLMAASTAEERRAIRRGRREGRRLRAELEGLA